MRVLRRSMLPSFESSVTSLLESESPSIRFLTHEYILDNKLKPEERIKLQNQIKNSILVKTLLSGRNEDGTIPYHPYNKWLGAHWILAQLAEIGYPEGDRNLILLREQVYEWLFSEKHQKSIQTINGKTRRCASQEGNTVYYLLKLGLADEKIDELVAKLLHWQWDDGGWNCDKKKEAHMSSFWESWIPLRALNLYSSLKKDKKSKAAVEKGIELFLSRKLFKRKSTGQIMHPYFTQLFYPHYWRYNFVSGLILVAECGFSDDPRVEDALKLIQSKIFPNGVFSAERKFYMTTPSAKSGKSLVDWGGVSKKQTNEWVTIECLYALKLYSLL